MNSEYDERADVSALDDEPIDITDNAPDGDTHDADEYYAIPKATRICSVLSLISALLSVLLCPIYYVGIVMAILAVVLSVVSSVRLGYFDKQSIFGLVIGIFGLVFGVFVLALDLTGVLDALLGVIK